MKTVIRRRQENNVCVIEIVMRQGEKENLAVRLASVTSYGTIIHKRPSCLQYTVQSPQDSSTSRLLRQGSRSLQEKHTTPTLIFCQTAAIGVPSPTSTRYLQIW